MKLLGLLLIVAALTGCAEAPPDVEEEPAVVYAPLHGWIFDEAERPVVGASVAAIENDQATLTDSEGYYAFEGLPNDVPVILVADFEGFEPLSKQVTLVPEEAVRVNFTLIRIPEKVPYHDRLPFNGFISCQIHVVTAEDSPMSDCSGGAAQDDTWDFSASPELAGAVVEIQWESGAPVSDNFYAKLETLGFGDQNIVLAETLGSSVLRLQVAEAVAAKYYAAGGQMRLTVHVSPNVDETETGAGVGLAVNQDFNAVASLFYVEPPPPLFTVT